MNSPSLMLTEAPELSDEAASEMLDFLYLFVDAFENRYRHQIMRHYESIAPPGPPQPELFDDELPDF